MLELSQVAGGWSFEWSRAHFGAWCIMSSPLILGLDLLSSVQMDQMWPIISNAEAIAVNQQWAGHAGWLVQSWTPDGAAKITESGDTPGCRHGGHVYCWSEPLDQGQVWCKPQPAGAVAVWVLNNSPHSELSYSVALSELELRNDSLFTVRDIWAGTSLAAISGRLHGSVAPMDSHLLLLSPLDPPPSPPSPPGPPLSPPSPNPSQPPLDPPPPSPPPPPPPPPSPPPRPPPPAPPVPPPFAPPLPPMPPPPLAPPSQPPSVLAMLQPPSLLAMLHLTTAPPLLLAAIGFLLLANVALLCWRRASRHRQQPRLEGHVTDRSSRSSRSPASTRRARVSSRGPTPPVRAVRQQRPARDVAPRRKSRRRSEERALDEVRLVHASSETEDVEEL